MKIKTMLASFAFLINGISLVSAQEISDVATHEASVIHSAERTIIFQMIRGLSRSVLETHEKLLAACPETETGLCEYVCPHPIASGGIIEFMIDFIGFSKSAAADDALVNLLALRLDAAGGEGVGCQFAIRGRALLSRLERLDAKSLAERCQADFQKRNSYITDVTVEQICRTEDEIDKKRVLMLEGIKAGMTCPLY